MPHTVILSARRTPIGSLMGELATVPTPQLAAVAIRAALSDSGIDSAKAQEVLLGCVLPAGVGQAPARQAAFAAGLPASIPCVTLNKMCGSGMKALMFADDAIRAGRLQCAIAGGMENMSRAPHLLTVRDGVRLGNAPLADHMFMDGLVDAYDGQLMGAHAQRIADEYGFSRQMMDDYAIASLQRAQASQQAENLAPVEVASKKGKQIIASDEQPRRAEVQKIPHLKPAFRADGTITAANSSSISDGAAALVVAADDFASDSKPLAHIVAQATFAEAPPRFPVAPIGAIRAVLAAAQWRVEDVDLFEINEAFAAVPMAAMHDLSLPADKVNVCGGACAIGHPVGASGARIVVTLLNALRSRGGGRGVAALCIGGGEATALALSCELS